MTRVNNRLLLPCTYFAGFVFLERRNLFSVSNHVDFIEDICYLYIVGLNLLPSYENAGH